MDDAEHSREELVGGLAISSFLDDRLRLPSTTLRDLSGDTSLADPNIFPSGLVRSVARAWTTPLSAITCSQVRLLVGQKFGLEWLAAAVAIFVTRHPRAECDFYPGDLAIAALRAHDELLRFAPQETAEMLRSDFHWMAEVLSFDRALLGEATACLDEARRAASDLRR